MKNPFKPVGKQLSTGHSFQSIFKSSLYYFTALTMFDSNASSIILLALEKMDIDNKVYFKSEELDEYLGISDKTRKKAIKAIKFMSMAKITNDNRNGGVVTMQINALLAFGGNKDRIKESEDIYKEDFGPGCLDENGKVNKELFKNFGSKGSGIPF